MSQRGSVILHVLVSSVVVALIAAVLLRMAMLRYLVTARAHKATHMKRLDEAALAQLNSNWSDGQMCTNFGTYNCGGWPADTCGCTCTSTGRPSIITIASGSTCQLRISSPDLAPAPQ